MQWDDAITGVRMKGPAKVSISTALFPCILSLASASVIVTTIDIIAKDINTTHFMSYLVKQVAPI